MPRVFQPIAHKIDAVCRTSDIKTVERLDFSSLHLSPHVLNGLKNSGFERPSPIQLRAIPIGRIGLDVIAQAKSGTGKTCVFGVIILEAMNLKVQKCQCVVVAPTREIAAQIQTVLSTLACDMPLLKCTLVIGGTNLLDDKEAIVGAHVVIGTPGRLLHLIEDAILDTECVRTLVLDEADKLVDESFYSQVKSLACQLPKSKQVLAMSATYHKDIDTKFNTLMRDPYYVRLSADNLGLEGIHHYFYTVKTDKVKHQIFCNKISRLVEVLSHVVFEQCLVFSNYQTGAEEISVCLTREGFSNQLIAGSMPQKDRSQAMTDFRECRFRVLISTDVTARGIDNEHVDLVVNMDLPVNTLGKADPHTYLHRAGRAGRFGKYGSAISIIASQKEHMFIQDLEEKYQVEVKEGPTYSKISELLRRSKAPDSNQSATLHPPSHLQPTNNLPTDSSNNLPRDASGTLPVSLTPESVFTSPLPPPHSTFSEPTPPESSPPTSTHSSSNGWFQVEAPVQDLNILRTTVSVNPRIVSGGSVMNCGEETDHSGIHTASQCDPCDNEAPANCHVDGGGVNGGSVNGNGDGGSVNGDGARQEDEFCEEKIDKDAALSSLGSLGKIPSGQGESAGLPSEDDAPSVFKFSSQDVTTYQSEDQSLFTEALGSLSHMPEDAVDTPSTSGSNKHPSEGGSDGNRSRRGSKNQKKARKPPKSLSVTSPKTQSGRRAAAADLANTAILSPHTPKWRSEAVSSAGCLIHSKAINVKFLLENYLCIKCEFVDKHYENDWRGFLPQKSQILQKASTAPCEVAESCEKSSLSRFVSHGFVANSSDQDPLAGKRTPPDVAVPPQTCRGDKVQCRQSSCDILPTVSCGTPPTVSCGTPPTVFCNTNDVAPNTTKSIHEQLPKPSDKHGHVCRQSEDNPFDDPSCCSFNSLGSSSQGRMCHSLSSVGTMRSACCGGHIPQHHIPQHHTHHPHPHHHKHGELPELHREQSRDSGVFSHTSPYPSCRGDFMPPPCHWWHVPPTCAPQHVMTAPHMCPTQQNMCAPTPTCTSPSMCGQSQVYGQPPVCAPSQVCGQPTMCAPSQVCGQPPMCAPSQVCGQPAMFVPSPCCNSSQRFSSHQQFPCCDDRRHYGSISEEGHIVTDSGSRASSAQGNLPQDVQDGHSTWGDVWYKAWEQ